METTRLKSLKTEMEKLLEEVKSEMEEMLDIAPLKGVQPVTGNICIVSVSSVSQTEGIILDPVYYIPSIQEKAVRYMLTREGLTLDDIEGNLEKMLRTGKASYKPAGGRISEIRLNTKTIESLQRVKQALG